jgi:hypothetical protein
MVLAEEAEVMAARVTSRGRRNGSVAIGNITLILGIFFVAAVGFTFVLSLSDVVDPPNWVRVIGLAGLPIGFFGAPVGFVLARRGPGRDRALVGLVLMLVGLAAFVALNFAIG